MSDNKQDVKHSKARKTVGYLFTFLLAVFVISGLAVFLAAVQALLK